MQISLGLLNRKNSPSIIALLAVVLLAASGAIATRGDNATVLSELPAPTGSTNSPSTNSPSTSTLGTSVGVFSGLRTDVIIGRGTKGPYELSFSGIEPRSEDVDLDALRLSRDITYSLDAAKGEISFAQPLQPNQMVRVTYSLVPFGSRLNTSSVILPLNWSLWNQGDNLLSLESIYNPASDTPLSSSLKFASALHLSKSTQLTSTLFTDVSDANALAHSGAQFGGSTHLGYTDLAATYSIAGAHYSGPSIAGLVGDSEALHLSAGITPVQPLKISLGLTDTSVLATANGGSLVPGGPVTLDTNASVTYSLSKKAGAIQIGTDNSTVTQQNGTTATTVTDNLSVQHSLGTTTSATVAFKSVGTSDTVSGVTTAAYTQTTSVDVKSQPTKNLLVTGNFQTTPGASDTDGIHLEAMPFSNYKQLKIVTSYQDIFDATGVQRSRQASIELPVLPFARTKITGVVSQTSQPGASSVVTSIDASSQPGRYVKIDGAVKLREGTITDNTPDPNAVNSFKVKLALIPSKVFSITSDVAHNTTTGSDVQHVDTQNVGIATQFGFIKLSGQIGQLTNYLAGSQSNTLSLGADLRLTKLDVLSTAFKQDTLLDQSTTDTRTYTLGFTHKLNTVVDFSLSGSMVQHLLNGLDTMNPAELKAEAQLGLHF